MTGKGVTSGTPLIYFGLGTVNQIGAANPDDIAVVHPKLSRPFLNGA